MQKKRQNESHSALSQTCKVYCISWKDERWSASKEDLKNLNVIIKANAKPSLSLFRRVINMISYLKHAMKWIMRFGSGS